MKLIQVEEVNNKLTNMKSAIFVVLNSRCRHNPSKKNQCIYKSSQNCSANYNCKSLVSMFDFRNKSQLLVAYVHNPFLIFLFFLDRLLIESFSLLHALHKEFKFVLNAAAYICITLLHSVYS